MKTDLDKCVLIHCDYGVHALYFEFDKGSRQIQVSMWEAYPKSSQYGLLYRLRHIWQIIRYGIPCADAIYVDVGEASTLARFLDECAFELKGADSIPGED